MEIQWEVMEYDWMSMKVQGKLQSLINFHDTTVDSERVFYRIPMFCEGIGIQAIVPGVHSVMDSCYVKKKQ